MTFEGGEHINKCIPQVVDMYILTAVLFGLVYESDGYDDGYEWLKFYAK